MVYYVQRKPMHNSVKVLVMQRYVDDDHRPRVRPVDSSGSSKLENVLHLFTKEAFASIAWLKIEPPRLRLPHETLLDVVCEERQNPRPHYEELAAEQSYHPEYSVDLTIGPQEVFGPMLNRADFAEVFEGKSARALQVLRTEVIRQIMDRRSWYRSDDQLKAHENRQRLGALNKLTPPRIDRLRTCMARLVTDTLGTAPTEAVLLVDSKQYKWKKETDWREWNRPESDSPRQRSLSRELTFAVLQTPEGLPIDFWIFTNPSISRETLGSIHAEIRRRHGDLRTTVIAQRKFFGKDGASVVNVAGFGYVANAAIPSLPPALTEQLHQLDRYQPPDKFGTRVRAIPHNGRMLIAYQTGFRTHADKTKRKRNLSAATRMLESGEIRPNPYLTVDPQTGPRLRPEQFEQDACWDGVRTLWTDNQQIPVDQIVNLYFASGWLHEEFDLVPYLPSELPVRYWTDQRLVAHAAVSFCAFTLRRLLFHQLDRYEGLLESFSEEQILKCIEEIWGTVHHGEYPNYRFLEPAGVTELQRAVYNALGLRLPESALPLGFVTAL